MSKGQGLLCPVKRPFDHSRYLAGNLIARPDRVVASLRSGDGVIADGCLIGLPGGTLLDAGCAGRSAAGVTSLALGKICGPGITAACWCS